MIERNRRFMRLNTELKGANFVLDKVNFAVECGQFDEKFNEGQDKICHLQPIDGILNILSSMKYEDCNCTAQFPYRKL